MIYVDDIIDYGNAASPHGKWCHMLSDVSLEELHAFAARLGLKRSWFQAKSSPHYDLRPSKRAMALRLGAVEADARTVVRIIRYWREKERSQ